MYAYKMSFIWSFRALWSWSLSYDCDEDGGGDDKKDKCVFWELVELDQKLATSGSKTNRAREAESCLGQMKEKHQNMGSTEILIKSDPCNRN